MKTATIVIGRNEGKRLADCLQSVIHASSTVVYVDSGSTDGSVAHARSVGVSVVELDMSKPFTAARARNAGRDCLRAIDPEIVFIQFVDGDCVMNGDWFTVASNFLSANPTVAAVTGRLRERHPDASVYNLLCDLEWDAPAGETSACGGIAMFRTTAFDEAGGFRNDLIAGEEPELCVRLRAAGWKVWRLPDEMALHDAAMTRFGQWWKRMRRGGYAFAQGFHMHGAPPENHGRRETRRIWTWGVALPMAIGASAFASPALAAVLACAYPFQIARIARSGRRSARTNWIQALFLMIGKFPEAIGQITYLVNRLAGRRGRIIEYK